MANEITTRVATIEILNIIRQHPITGLATDLERYTDGAPFGLHIDWQRGWAIGAGLEVQVFDKRVSVTWSSTGRDPMTAVACVALYREVSELACLIQCALNEMNIAEP